MNVSSHLFAAMGQGGYVLIYVHLRVEIQVWITCRPIDKLMGLMVRTELPYGNAWFNRSAMNAFLMSLASGACFLFSFLLLHRSRAQGAAFRWLAGFALFMGTAFLGIYWGKREQDTFHLVALLNTLQFLMAPCLLLGVLHFTDRGRPFRKADFLHFLPFIVYWMASLLSGSGEHLFSLKLLAIGSTDLLLRDLLPLQLMIYISCAYVALLRRKRGGSPDAKVPKPLHYLLLTLLIVSFFWLNDALLGIGVLLKLMPLAYAGSVFLLAYFTLGLPMGGKPAAALLPVAVPGAADTETESPSRDARLDTTQLAQLSERLEALMTVEKIYLDNELSLPALAGRLGASVHDTSYLINEITGNNYYHLVNSKRVAEARQLLSSEQADRLSMVGIAFAAGFNSKTAFNTAFKKWTGLSPTAFRQQEAIKGVRMDNPEQR